MLSSQAAHTLFKSTGNGLDRDDDKDPRDVTNTSFNRFDPKYISIGPKAVRGNNNLNIVAAATANKCATLRHVGRYGGSLKGTTVSPNLRSAKTPSIATVLKDYCQQPDCVPQTYTTEMIVPQQQQQPPPPPAPLPPPPKPKTTNTFTEIPGTTGVGSSYAKEQQLQQQLQQLQQLHQQMQQQQQQQIQQQQLQQLQMQQQQMQQQQVPPPPPPQTQPQPQQQQLQLQLPQHHPPTTHILPPSAVYSIETSGYQQQQQQKPQPPQRSPQPTATPREPIRQQQRLPSIVNQPLPDIPQSAVQPPPQQQQPQSKISPQPLCAANLNQYRSLQRPQTQKLQVSAQAQPQQQQQQQQQQPKQQQQQYVPQQAQQQPPSLPPKNRNKLPRTVANANNVQTLPPKSASLRQQQSTSFGYERERDRERERAERHERPRRAETLDNARSSDMAYMEHYGSSGIKKQHSYDAAYVSQQQQYYSQQLPHRHALPASTANNNYHSTSSKHQQQLQQQFMADQQHMYYRSLKRGGSHANSDLYSVTEL